MNYFQSLHLQLLMQAERRRAISIVSGIRPVTTQKAAELLKVSPEYLVRIIEQNKVPYRQVGAHKRIRFEDLEAYKRRDDLRRRLEAEEREREVDEQGSEVDAGEPGNTKRSTGRRFIQALLKSLR